MSNEERPPLRVVVVDDEALSRHRVLNLLEARADVLVVAECDNAEAALVAIREARPDVLFLDVRMPEVDGFELLGRLGADRPHVILVTAHEEHALRGFEEEAVDFLLKPFDRRRFEQALERAARRVRSRDQDALVDRMRALMAAAPAPRSGVEAGTGSAAGEADASDEPLRKLVVTTQSRKVLVDVADIRWIEAADYYARLHTSSASHLIRRSLSWLEERLDARRFVRIHRSSIVNVDHVREIGPWSRGSWIVRLHDGTELRLSGGRKAELERLLGQSL
jgi:two-component system, LytTR family, response regulator